MHEDFQKFFECGTYRETNAMTIWQKMIKQIGIFANYVQNKAKQNKNQQDSAITSKANSFYSYTVFTMQNLLFDSFYKGYIPHLTYRLKKWKLRKNSFSNI